MQSSVRVLRPLSCVTRPSLSSRAISSTRHLDGKPTWLSPPVGSPQAVLRPWLTLPRPGFLHGTGAVLGESNGEEAAEKAAAQEEDAGDSKEEEEEFSPRRRRAAEEERDPRDRTRVIPVDLSIRYMESAAYRETYGDELIWHLYRRNFHKGKTWAKTRPNCVKDGRLMTGNPCPICRDEYLVVDYRNLKLIEQFINEYNGEILDRERTGVCQKQWLNIRVALEKAKDHGYLQIDPPFVEYDYDKYRPKGNLDSISAS